jgi:RNA polymerase sigma-70 factor (ECF subfamily)
LSKAARASTTDRTSNVVALPFQGNDESLVRGCVAGRANAREALFVRFAPLVRRILVRTLGPTDELADVLQEVFVEAFASIRQLRDPSSLRAWISRIAVNRARRSIRSARRRRWLRFFSPDELPERPQSPADLEQSDAVARLYRVLESLPEEERVVLCLHRINETPLEEIARLCDLSLATTRRRLARANERLARCCAADPALRQYVGDTNR